MATVNISYAGTKIEAIGKLIENPETVLNRIGAHLVARSQRAFRDQVRDPAKPWPERMVPNVMGVLNDLNRGAKIAKRRFDPRPALVDTGALRNSISYQFISRKVISFGSMLGYASLQNFGGESKLWVSKKILDNLTIVMRTERRKFARDEKKKAGSGNRGILDLGWLYSYRGEFFKINVRAREFIAFDDTDHAAAERIVLDEARKL